MRQRISMIANFRKPGRWSVLAMFLVTAAATAAFSEARPDLTGQILAKSGAPLPVPATVFIATASPKVGTSWT